MKGIYKVLVYISMFLIIIGCAVGGCYLFILVVDDAVFLGFILGTLAGFMFAAVSCGPSIFLFSIDNRLSSVDDRLSSVERKLSSPNITQKETNGYVTNFPNISTVSTNSSTKSQTQEAPEGWVCPSCGTTNPFGIKLCQNCQK